MILPAKLVRSTRSDEWKEGEEKERERKKNSRKSERPFTCEREIYGRLITATAFPWTCMHITPCTYTWIVREHGSLWRGQWNWISAWFSQVRVSIFKLSEKERFKLGTQVYTDNYEDIFGDSSIDGFSIKKELLSFFPLADIFAPPIALFAPPFKLSGPKCSPLAGANMWN